MSVTAPRWTETEDQYLRDNRGKKSSSVIAAELCAMGFPATRNAVIGRAKRIGLDRLRVVCGQHYDGRRRSAKGAPKIRVKRLSFDYAPPPAIENMRLVEMVELGWPEQRQECRYIQGEPTWDAKHCGLPTLKGHSWCRGHAALVYEPRTPKPPVSLNTNSRTGSWRRAA